MPLNPAGVLQTLATQHAELRERMDLCDALIADVEAGRREPALLTREVIALRLAFEAHNAFEESVLRPLLRRIDAFAAARTERMIEDHINEHRAMNDRLGLGDATGLRDVIETLRAHLEAEERYLLSPRVLHDDARP